MLTQIGNALKAIAFCLLCIAILEKIELPVVIPMILYVSGITLVNVAFEDENRS